MAQDRLYTVSFTAVAITVAVDIFELTPADDKPIEILGFFWSQSSDVGDAASEILPYRVIRGHTVAGSGGATTTPRPLNRSGAAAGFTCKTNNTTAANTGTTVDLHADSINIMAGEKLWLPEGCEWEASQGDTTILIRLAAAPTDSLTTSGTLYVREQG
jgi:hypothetical protein